MTPLDFFPFAFLTPVHPSSLSLEAIFSGSVFQITPQDWIYSTHHITPSILYFPFAVHIKTIFNHSSLLLPPLLEYVSSAKMSWALRPDGLGSKSWFLFFLAVWPWAHYLDFLKVKLKKLQHHPDRLVLTLKWVNKQKTLSVVSGR